MTKPLTPELFIEAFRSRHGWKCRPGSPIVKDLTDFAIEQANSKHSPDELYVIFCITYGIKPKLEGYKDDHGLHHSLKAKEVRK